MKAESESLGFFDWVRCEFRVTRYGLWVIRRRHVETRQAEAVPLELRPVNGASGASSGIEG
jgi:hypothetical protein